MCVDQKRVSSLVYFTGGEPLDELPPLSGGPLKELLEIEPLKEPLKEPLEIELL
jgi:hypothetical protein